MFAQVDKYFPNHRKYLFSDKSADIERDGWSLITYDDTEKYQNRMISCLEKIDDEIILFHHEDMFLYSEPKYEMIDNISEIVSSGEIDIVKLICASYGPIDFRNITSLSYIYQNPPNLKFAIQPSVCNLKKLIEIYKTTSGENIWEFESNSSIVSDYLGIETGMVHLPSEQKRGEYHWDSLIYPYFATAIVKGKWNYTDYEDKLSPMLKECGVDVTIRGTC
tara:strand:- start:3005 stop:3667 length:663 start_codon:yes stop_codon:yes gene_type:complete